MTKGHKGGERVLDTFAPGKLPRNKQPSKAMREAIAKHQHVGQETSRSAPFKPTRLAKEIDGPALLDAILEYQHDLPRKKRTPGVQDLKTHFTRNKSPDKAGPDVIVAILQQLQEHGYEIPAKPGGRKEKNTIE